MVLHYIAPRIEINITRTKRSEKGRRCNKQLRKEMWVCTIGTSTITSAQTS